MDGPKDPSFWLYGEENPDYPRTSGGRLKKYRCPRCGAITGAKTQQYCPKCKVPMREEGDW